MPRITEIWAWVAQDSGPQDEGMLAHEVTLQGRRMIAPMVGADMERIRSLEPLVRDIVQQTGQSATLARFTVRTDLATIDPQ